MDPNDSVLYERNGDDPTFREVILDQHRAALTTIWDDQGSRVPEWVRFAIQLESDSGAPVHFRVIPPVSKAR